MRTVGIETNGVGQISTSHLNLTRSIADVERGPKGLPMVKMSKRLLPAIRPPFAGYDPTERAL